MPISTFQSNPFSDKVTFRKEIFVGASERQRELRRRRKRYHKLSQLKGKLAKATQSEKLEIVRKLREMSPGAEKLIVEWELVEAGR